MSHKTAPPILPPGSRFLLAALGCWLLLQTLLIMAGTAVRSTESIFRPGIWLLIFAAGIAMAVLAHRPLARETGGPGCRNEGGLLTIAIILPLFFSPLSTVAFLTPKFFLLGFFALFLLFHGQLPGYPLRTEDRPWLLILIVLTAGCLRGPDLPGHVAMALPVLGIWGAYAVISRSAARVKDPQFPLRLTDVLLACSVIPSFYAILQNFDLDFSGVFDLPGGRAQVFATLGNVNWLGIYLAMLLPLAAVRFRLARTNSALISSWFIGHLAAAALLFTRSRSSWLAVLVALTWLTVLRFHLGRKRLPIPLPAGARLIRLEPLVVIGLLALFSLPFLTRVHLPDRIAMTFRADYNVAQRFHVWGIALDMFRARPLLGNGTGSFARDFLDAQARRLADEKDETRLRLGGNAREAHNEYIQFLAENGILGLLAFFFLLFTLLLRLRSLLSRGEPATAWLAAGWSALLAAVLSDACFSFPLQLPVSGLLFALGCGVLHHLKTAGEEAAEPVPKSLLLPRIAAVPLAALLLLTVVADGFTAIGGDRMKFNRMQDGRALLETALTLQPWRGDTLFLLGTSSQSLGELLTAETLLLQARRFTNDKGIATNLAFLLNQRGEKTRAAELFRQAWLYEPRSCEAACNMAIQHLQQGQTAEAQLFLQRALAENPHYPPAWNEQGFLHLRRKQTAGARNAFEQIVTRNPAELAQKNFRNKVYLYANPVALHAEYAKAWYGLAQVALLENDRKRAEESYRQSLKFQPGNPLSTYQFGLLLVQAGRFGEAERLLAPLAATSGPWAERARQLLENLKRMSPR